MKPPKKNRSIAADPDALAARGEGVPELVQHDRAEEQERGDHRGDEALVRRG